MDVEDRLQHVFADIGRLHRLRLIRASDAVTQAKARNVLDIGCGDGTLLLHLGLVAESAVLRGFDTSSQAISMARAKVRMCGQDGRIVFSAGGFRDHLAWIRQADAICMVEVIEHLDDEERSQLEFAVFRDASPALVVVTTPNADYNAALGTSAKKLRRTDHQFEWSRRQFRGWAEGIASMSGHDVSIHQIGYPTPALGGITQMAIFAGRRR